MTREFSLAHLTVLQCSPSEMVTIAANAGYAFVSFRLAAVTDNEPVYPLLRDRSMMQEAKNRLSDTGLRVLDIELARIPPETEPETYLPLLEAGGELGARSVIAQLPDSDQGRVIDRFSRLCELAKPFDLTIDLEFPSWTQIPNLEAAARVLNAVGAPNAGILVDTLHFDRSASSLETLRNLPREWFHFVHLCDAPEKIPLTTEGLIHTARADRSFPGEGGIDLKPILDCMPNVPYSLEIPNQKLMEQWGPEKYAHKAIRTAEKFFREHC